MRVNLKLLILIVLVILVLVGMLIWLFVRNRSSNLSTQNWQVQQTKEYKVSYPKDWTWFHGTVINGLGSHDVVKPMAADQRNPQIVIQTTDAATTSTEKVEAVLKTVNYKTVPIVVNGTATRELFGRLPAIKTYPAKQFISFVVQKDNKVYLVELSYLSDQPDPSLEQIFTQFYREFRPN